MTVLTKFKCSSCQYEFEHDASEKECFCPKCGKIAVPCEEAAETSVCPECSTEVPSNASVCPNCGHPLRGAGMVRCSECGTEFPYSLRTCPTCGCPTVTAPVAPYIPPVFVSQMAAPPTPPAEEEEFSLPKGNDRTIIKWIVIGALGFIALFIAGLCYYSCLANIMEK